MDNDIVDLVGIGREEIVIKHLEQNAKNVEHRTETLIQRARQRLAQHRAGILPAKVAAEWKAGADPTIGLKYSTTVVCPACGADGVLEGDDELETEVEWEQVSEDDFEAIVKLTVSANYFSCRTCQLVLDGYEYIEQAGLSIDFAAIGDPADYYGEQDYGND